MTTSRSKFVKCPFYRLDQGSSVGCSGITDDSNITVRFHTRAGLDTQMKVFCQKQYDHCEVFRMLWDIYDAQ